MQRMMGVKCKKCGKIFYPKRARCINCKSKELEDIEMGDKCKLVTYTKLYAIPMGIKQIPLPLGIVEFENGARALGQITAEELEIGMNLRPVWGPLRKIRGKEVYGFEFEPVVRKK